MTYEEIESYALMHILDDDSVEAFREMQRWIDGAIWMRDYLNTENIRGLDENLDEKVIEPFDNQESLSHKKDKKFTPELLQTYAPYAEELTDLLIRKKLGMPTIVKAQSIIQRCHLNGMEVGYDAALRFTKQIKNGD